MAEEKISDLVESLSPYQLIEREEAAASLMEDKYNALCAAHDSYCDGDGQFMTRDEILLELIPVRDDWDRIMNDLVLAEEQHGEEVIKKARRDFVKAMQKKDQEAGGEMVWCKGCGKFHPATAFRTRR
jgi:hypothetical protein